jgi:hypothetical protein
VTSFAAWHFSMAFEPAGKVDTPSEGAANLTNFVASAAVNV